MYRLASHIHLCRTAGRVVILDLKRNRYFGVSADDIDPIGRFVQGWPRARADEPGDAAARSSPDARTPDASLLEELLRDGILTPHTPTGPAVHTAQATVPRPQSALIDGYIDVETSIGARDLLNFATAVLFAAFALRWLPLERICARVEARGRRNCHRTIDLHATRQRVAMFARLRRFAFAARAACLFDSLAMHEFLSRYAICPHWVFGVATDPFVAHCWLQYQDVVVNDDPGYVRRYTPILVL